MTYALETRADNSVTKRLTTTTEMNILQTIDGKTLRDHIRNDTIREMCDVREVVDREGTNGTTL